jgi:hypothetical protein
MANKPSSALFFALGLGAASLANAGFIGKTVTGQHLFPDLATVFETSDATVGAGTEFSMLGGLYTVDVSDTNLVFNIFGQGYSFTPATFNGFHLFDTNGTIDAIVNVTIDSSNLAGFDPSRISFDANNIWVNFQSLSLDPASTVSLNVAFATTQPPNPNPTPEPATLALLGLGLAGLGAMRRKA